MRREGEEEKWYFQDVKKDVKSSPSLCHWQFFLKSKNKITTFRIHCKHSASVEWYWFVLLTLLLPCKYLLLIFLMEPQVISQWEFDAWLIVYMVLQQETMTNLVMNIHESINVLQLQVEENYTFWGRKKNLYQLISINGLGHESFPKERTWPLDAEERRIWAVLSLVGLRTKSLAIERGL